MPHIPHIRYWIVPLVFAVVAWNHLSWRQTVRVLAWCAALFLVWLFWPTRALYSAPGILAESPPRENAISLRTLPQVDAWHLTARATYQIHARVLDTESYWYGAEGDLSPIDVLLGWGKMSDQEVLDNASIQMRRRTFHLQWEDESPVLDDSEVERQTTVNHLIYGNDAVRKVIKSLRVGQLLTLTGYSVSATLGPGLVWDSSKDTGELVYVETATAETPATCEKANWLGVKFRHLRGGR